MAGKKEPVVNEETMVEEKEPVVNEEIMAEKKVAVANDLVRFRIAKDLRTRSGEMCLSQ